MKKVLITGGAGYKGVVLTEELLDEGFDVTILDNFMYGFEPVIGFVSNPYFHVNKKDVRNIEKEDVEEFDIVFHLAGISGFPACEANPHSAETINVTATERLISLLDKDQVLVYASTTSMYGQSGEELDETAVPTPVSLYGVTKYKAEQICMQHEKAIAFRFATIFGVSARMRWDLLLNDFVHKAKHERSLVLFDAHSVRTFVHLRDAIQAYVMAAKNPEPMLGEIFNVGANDMNFSKLQLAQKINEIIDFEIIETQLKDPDRRHFVINFDKISRLGYKPTITIDEGIKELIRLYSWYQPKPAFNTI